MHGLKYGPSGPEGESTGEGGDCKSMYSFRIRFRMADRTKIDSKDTKMLLSKPDQKETVVLKPRGGGELIGDTRDLVLEGAGYTSDSEAQQAGNNWQSFMAVAFARLAIGVDFGNRAPKSVIMQHGLEMLKAQTGFHVLNDVHGMMTFISEPAPKFATAEVQIVAGKSGNIVKAAIQLAADMNCSMSARQQLAYDLFSGSFFQPAADGRFVMLMMAVETLIELQPRPPQSQSFVASLIDLTQASNLAENEIQSISGSLQWLLNESIGRAGRRLAKKLDGRKYMNESPVSFFTNCYELRSKLVHGHYPRPTREEVDGRAASLELFVGDLLSIPLLNALG